MILPVGWGWQEGIPSPKYSLIVASGHSPLSFASGRWSPQRSILGTTVPSLAYDGLVPRPEPYVDKPQFTRPRLTTESIWPPAMGAKRSAWTAAQSCRIGRSNGSNKLTQSSRDNKSQEIFVVGLGISLCLIPLASMAPANARGTRQSTKLQRLRREMTARSRGPQSPRRGHAIQWHGLAVFDNLYR